MDFPGLPCGMIDWGNGAVRDAAGRDRQRPPRAPAGSATCSFAWSITAPAISPTIGATRGMCSLSSPAASSSNIATAAASRSQPVRHGTSPIMARRRIASSASTGRRSSSSIRRARSGGQKSRALKGERHSCRARYYEASWWSLPFWRLPRRRWRRAKRRSRNSKISGAPRSTRAMPRAVAAMYTEDAYVLPSGAPWRKGRDDIQKFWTRGDAATRRHQMHRGRRQAARP